MHASRGRAARRAPSTRADQRLERERELEPRAARRTSRVTTKSKSERPAGGVVGGPGRGQGRAAQAGRIGRARRGAASAMTAAAEHCHGCGRASRLHSGPRRTLGAPGCRPAVFLDLPGLERTPAVALGDLLVVEREVEQRRPRSDVGAAEIEAGADHADLVAHLEAAAAGEVVRLLVVAGNFVGEEVVDDDRLAAASRAGSGRSTAWRGRAATCPCRRTLDLLRLAVSTRPIGVSSDRSSMRLRSTRSSRIEDLAFPQRRSPTSSSQCP